MKIWNVGGALLLALAAVACAQTGNAGGGQLVFGMDHTGTVLPSYTLTVQEDGSAVYAVSYPPEPPKYSPYAAVAATGANAEVSKDVLLSSVTTKMLFERVRATNGLQSCESPAKNIAKTGLKTLKYNAPGTAASCTWNYSEDKNVMAVGKAFEAIAVTLDEGRKIEQKHRYDRLALDPEVQYLCDGVKQGNAIELGTIAPVLRSIADDPQVLERVRAKAVKLLGQSGTER